MNKKQKVRIKIQQINIDIYSNMTLLELIYLNQDVNSKRVKAGRYCLPKSIIKIYNIIINGKNFYDQPIVSDIKRYKEVRKLTTGQGEDYTTGCIKQYSLECNQ